MNQLNFKPDKSHIKPLGRTYFNEQNQRWCVGTCSGIEFSMTGTKVTLHILGDNFATDPEQKDLHARMAVYMNEQLILDTMIDEPEKDYVVLDAATPITAVVRVLKLSESAFGDFAIADIKVISDNRIIPTPMKQHNIEFIGDSITCGYGVEDYELEGSFKTSTENGSKSFAYKTIQALDADYGICSASGFGIVSGYTGDGVKVEDELLPPYYDKISFSRSTHKDGVNPCQQDWDFSRFQPEAIVINLGTNDTSYVEYAGSTEKQKERMEEFTVSYVEFLKKVRGYNPNARIFCILGIMGNMLYPCVEDAVARYSSGTGDDKVMSLGFEEQKEEDGYCLNWHPCEVTHSKAAKTLTHFLRQQMGW